MSHAARAKGRSFVPSLKRAKRNGDGSTSGVSPATRSAISFPAPGPALGDRRVLEDGEGGGDVGARLAERRAVRLGVEHADFLKGRFGIEAPASRRPPFLDEAATDPKPKSLLIHTTSPCCIARKVAF